MKKGALMEILFVIWIGLAFVAASVARSKGRSGVGYFVLSCLLSFLVAIIVLAIVPSLKTTSAPVTEAQCPFCREDVKADAVVCKHCGRDIEPIVLETVKPYFETAPSKVPLGTSGKWGVALILIGTISLLTWVSGMKTWSSSNEADVPLWGRILTLIVEVAILVWGIILHSRAVKRANDKLSK
jgi:hypothetical protein